MPKPKRFTADLDESRFTKLQVFLASKGKTGRKFLEDIIDKLRVPVLKQK